MLSRRWHAGHLLLAVLALALLWSAVRAVDILRQPQPQPPAAAGNSETPAILETVDPFFPAANERAEAPVTTLALVLHGLRSDGITGRGSAILSAADGVQQVYAVGDSIADGVVLAAIQPDHVLLDHRGAMESLWLDSGGDGEVQRQDPLAYQPMPVAELDDENMLPASDAPAPAAGVAMPAAEAAVMPAVPADPESGNTGDLQ